MERLEGNCAVCSTSEGKKSKLGYPIRYSGEPYDIKGVLCQSCYSREHRRKKSSVSFTDYFDIKITITEVGDYYKNKNNKNLLARLQRSETTDRIAYEIVKRNRNVLVRGSYFMSTNAGSVLNFNP